MNTFTCHKRTKTNLAHESSFFFGVIIVHTFVLKITIKTQRFLFYFVCIPTAWSKRNYADVFVEYTDMSNAKTFNFIQQNIECGRKWRLDSFDTSTLLRNGKWLVARRATYVVDGRFFAQFFWKVEGTVHTHVNCRVAHVWLPCRVVGGGFRTSENSESLENFKFL